MINIFKHVGFNNKEIEGAKKITICLGKETAINSMRQLFVV